MSTFDVIADIIADACGIERDKIQLDSNIIEDLGVDSLDFLDVNFAIDKAFGIKLPVDEWTQAISEGRAKPEDYFIVRNLAAQIDRLVALKQEPA